MSDQSFRKEEKLKSTKEFSELFEKGRSFTIFPFKVVYKFSSEKSDAPATAAFSVSKRYFKKAVHRNRIKRLMREAYRLNKKDFYRGLGTLGLSCRLILIYTGRELPQFAECQQKIILILQRLLSADEEVSKRRIDTSD